MKTPSSLLSLVILALLAGCATTSPQRDLSGMPPINIVTTVSCSDPAIKFTGTIVSDGHTRNYSGTGSGTFHATGHDIICSFKKTGTAGRISIAASTSDKGQGNSTTDRKFGGVRAEFLRAPKEQHDIFTTF